MLTDGPRIDPDLTSFPPTMAPRRPASPRPTSPTHTSFRISQHPPSSFGSNATTANRLTDALASINGRARTFSSPSNPKISSSSKGKPLVDSAEPNLWSNDADPFASTYAGNTSFMTYPTPPALSSPLPSSASAPTVPSSKKHQRGSILLAASDAFNFGRGLGAAFTRRRTKTVPVPRGESQQQQEEEGPPQPPSHGLLWNGKGKWKGKAKWALQPPSSPATTTFLPDVIEISAATSTSVVGAGRVLGTRGSVEDEEERERERLREAAAESIGIGPLMREEAASRGASLISHEEDAEETSIYAGAGPDSEIGPETEVNTLNGYSETIQGFTSEKTRSDAFRPVKPNGLQLQGLNLPQTSAGGRVHRSASLSIGVPPLTPTSTTREHTSPVGHSLVARIPATPTTISAPPYVPAFPCTHASLGSAVQMSAMLPKHYPSPSLLRFSLSRPWRARFIVLTSPNLSRLSSPPSPSTVGASVSPVAFHLHLFKSSAGEERELERLEINENSVVFVAEEEVAGRRSVVKVGGVDVGTRKKDLNLEEEGRTMWLLHMVHISEAQSWIAAVKDAVLAQRAERVGLGKPMHHVGALEPRGDMDVMLSMHAQGLITPPASAEAGIQEMNGTTRTSSSNGRSEASAMRDNNVSPTPTVRSWSSESKSAPTIAVSALKGLFAVPGRPRSSSRASSSLQKDQELNYPEDTASFTNRGNALLSMLRSGGSAASASTSPRSTHVATSPISSPGSLHSSILPISTTFSQREQRLDRPIVQNPEIVDWSSFEDNTCAKPERPKSIVSQRSLQPAPRVRRPWTSSGISGSKFDGPGIVTKPLRASLQAPSASSALADQNGDGSNKNPYSPGSANGTTTSIFGTPEQRPRRPSMSSSISSFASAFVDRDQNLDRSSSSTKRRSRMGKLPQRLTPPTGPPPSVPRPPSLNSAPSRILDRTPHPYAAERPPSRASSTQNARTVDLAPSESTPRRSSTSSAITVSTVSTTQTRFYNLPAGRALSQPSVMPSKRASMPPPPRPVPTFALPPTPGHDRSSLKYPESAPPKRSSFRESLTNTSIRLSLAPPTRDAVPARPDEQNIRSHRRTSSNGSNRSRNPPLLIVPPSPRPRGPPPTGPLPPTPQEPLTVNRHTSIKRRLRMRSAPPPPSSLTSLAASIPSSKLPQIDIDQVINANQRPASPVLGEPITTMQNDPNFLNMTPIESTPPSTILSDDVNFLHMSSPLASTPPVPIPPPVSPHRHDPVLLYPAEGSPDILELRSLSPPPRRGARQASTENEKERDDGFFDSAAPTTPTTDNDDLRNVSHQDSAVSLGKLIQYE